jgi:hypothetical protein
VAAKKVLTPYDFNQNEVQNAVIQQLGTDPGSPVNGQFWVNTTTNVLKVRINGATISLGRLDQISVPTASVAMNGQRITGLADPSGAQDAATQAYVTGALAAVAGGTEWKAEAKLATAAALAANTYSSGAKTLTGNANGALTVDGVGVTAGDRILVKNEATGSNNGLYSVTNAGSGGAPYVLTRTSDTDSSTELNNGIIIPITSGTANANTLWVLTTTSITLDTTALSFSSIPLAGYTAGTGITLTGNAFGLTIPVAISSGGTGATSASAARTALGIVNKYTATGPGSGGTTWTVTHNLGTSDVVYMLRDHTTHAEVIADVVVTDANTLTITFGATVSSNTYDIVVIG